MLCYELFAAVLAGRGEERGGGQMELNVEQNQGKSHIKDSPMNLCRVYANPVGIL